MGWEKITKPKKVGGLGLQTSKGRNTALLAKLNWRFHTEGDAFWVRVLKHKYCSQQRLRSRNQNKLPCFRTWAGMKKGRATFQEGAVWVPSRESNLSCWFDKWSDMGILRNTIQGPLTRDSLDLKVKDVFSASGWDWARIPFELPHNYRMKIQYIPVSLASSGEDKLAWVGWKHDEFNLNSAYRTAAKLGPPQSFQGSWIWRLNILPRIQLFLWRCYHNSVGVRESLRNWGMDINPLCPLCHDDLENISHALRGCSWVKSVWAQLGIAKDDPSFHSQNLLPWLAANCTEVKTVTQWQISWNIVFMFAI